MYTSIFLQFIIFLKHYYSFGIRGWAFLGNVIPTVSERRAGKVLGFLLLSLPLLIDVNGQKKLLKS